MNNVMLDLETLGNGSNAAIISIGAVFFDPLSGELGADFYQTVDIESAMKYGKVDASTIKWWMKQDDPARAVFNDPHSIGICTALAEFSEWLMTNVSPKGNHGQLDVNVWGNGATFDNVILSNAYQAVNMNRPWPYWGDRDVRTIVELGKTLRGIDPKRDLEFIGTAHNALDDAKHQARYVSAIYQALSLSPAKEA